MESLSFPPGHSELDLSVQHGYKGHGLVSSGGGNLALGATVYQQLPSAAWWVMTLETGPEAATGGVGERRGQSALAAAGGHQV